MMLSTSKILHTCGHEVPHALPSSPVERRRREAWLSERPCPACWRIAERAEASSRCATWNLPPLEGTEDEKAWAEVIRIKVITHNREYHARVTREDNFRDGEADLKAAVQSAADVSLAHLQNETRAAWWIQNRFDAMNHLKRDLLAAVTPILEARRGK